MTAGCRFWLPLLCLPLALLGCRNKDLLETELRTKEIQYRELLDEHDRTQEHNRALQREIEALRKGKKLSAEQAAQIFNLKRIVLGRLTGGQDRDNKAGDDALLLVVEPRDGADHVIKAPGTLQVWTLEINGQGIKTPANDWTIPADELRRAWKSGLLSNGYVLTLPWKTYPLSEKMRVGVRLTTPDGRVFETDKDIRVRLVPGADRPKTSPPPDKGPDLFHNDILNFPRPADEQGQAPVRTAPVAPIAPAGTWRASPLDGVIRLRVPVPVNSD